jgi:hypothetical protein
MLPGKAAWKCCRAKLPGNAAGQGCRAWLQDKAAGKAVGQGCNILSNVCDSNNNNNNNNKAKLKPALYIRTNAGKKPTVRRYVVLLK